MAHSVIDINGNWLFKEYPVNARRMRDLDDGDWFDCTCPNSIFTNLIGAGQIDEKDLFANPEKYNWVSEKPWVLKKVFDVSQQMLESERIELICEGLDTIANVWLNEKLIGKTDNMFISHRFDITSYLKQKNNILLVKFEPVVNYAKKVMERYTPFSDMDFAHPYRSYVRKAQFQFGWDFCPSLPGCGIWRPVRIEGFNDARIDNFNIRTINCTEKTADISIALNINSITNKKLVCCAKIFGPDEMLKKSLDFELHKDSGSGVIHINDPQLWWPAGYGPQNLYKVEIDLLLNGKLVDRKTSNFGIRTLNLNQSPGKSGNRFQFEINSKPIHVKGANWLPITIFAGSANQEDYKRLLKTASDANINMLRVWGGGYYEDDLFYQLCDEYGVMVWQDFMFACAYYPDRQWFSKQVSTEARSIIKRIYNHPCLVLYCGNNEIHWLFSDLKKGRGRKFHGKTIFDKLLPKVLTELDPDRPYINSTPFSVKGKPNDPDSGTIHNWDIWAGHKPVREYITSIQNTPRFVTEFGSQSLPATETLKRNWLRKPKIASLPVEKHNYQIDGNSRLYRYTADIFGPTDNINKFVYLSQLAQARAAKLYVEFLRACSNRNSGVLFWQFNDVFPAISWSCIDYYKNLKALYYYTKRFFAPLLVTVLPQYSRAFDSKLMNHDWLGLVAVNDSDKPVTGKITCELTDFLGNKIDGMQLPVSIAPCSVLHPVKLPKALTYPEKPEKTFLKLILETEKRVIAQNLFFYLPDKYIEYSESNIEEQLNCIEKNRAILTLTSNSLKRDIYIETENCIKINDNFITLLPNETRQLELYYCCSIDKIREKTNIYSILT